MDFALFTDIAIILILSISLIVSFFRGFARETLTIGGMLFAFIGAYFFGDWMGEMYQNWFLEPVPEGEKAPKIFGLVPKPFFLMACGYATLFIGILIFSGIISHFLSKSIQEIGLGPIDRGFGLAFGLIRGVFILALLNLAFKPFISDEQTEKIREEAHFYTMIDQATLALSSFLPEFEDNPSDKKVADSEATLSPKEKDYFGRVAPASGQNYNN